MIKHAKKIAAAAFAVAALAGSLFAQAPSGSPVALHGQLSVKNGQIVDSKGEPFQLRGMSFFWSNPGWEGGKYYNSSVVNWLADDWKANIVRAAMDPSARGDWQKVVDAAIAKGIYVLIDWHSHKAQNETNDAKTFFSAQAAKYKDTPNVLYEIYNEPCPSGQQSGACAGDDWATQVRPYAQAVVDEIRKTDTKNLIVIGSANYSKRVDLAAANPVSGSNLVYSVHYYTAEPGTQHQQDLRGWCGGAMDKKQALLVTEFGLSEADGGNNSNKKCPNDLIVKPGWNGEKKCPTMGQGTYSNLDILDTTEANVWFDYLDKYQVGWVNWSIVDKNEAASALAGGAGGSGNWSDANLSRSGRFIRNKLRFYASTTYKLNVTVTGEGTYTLFPNSADNTYTHGVPVSVIAKPKTSGMEVVWSGDITTSKGDTAKVNMTSAKNVKVIFSAGGNLLQNGSFISATDPWKIYKNGLPDPAPNPTLTLDNAEGKITMTAAGTDINHTSLYQMGIKLTSGRAYKLSFTARGASARNITAKIVNASGSTSNPTQTPVLMAPADFALTAANKDFSKTFNMTGTTTTTAALHFCFGGNAVGWNITNVRLEDIGPADPTAVAEQPAAHKPASWSISKAGGELRLRGPAEPGARVSLYDTRGKAVKIISAKDGLTLTASGLPAGNYFLVVKNRAGADVYRSKVSFVR